MSTLALPPPSAFSYQKHCQNQQESRRVNSTTVYGTAWSPEGGRFLAACSSFGVICFWDMSGDDDDSDEVNLDANKSIRNGHEKRRKRGCLSKDYWVNDEGDNSGRNKSHPVLRIQASQGALYDLKSQKMNSTYYLIASGDSGVIVFKWSDFLDELLNGDDLTTTTRTISMSPVSTFAPHPSAAEKQGVEVNCISCDESLNVLYGAAGDLFGCYRWDFGTGRCLGTLSGHTDYLHAVKAVPGRHHVLTGGEDGQMGVWDGKEGKLVEMIDCRDTMDNNKALTETDTTQSRDWSWGNDSHLWVSSIDVDDCGNWGAVCGGAEGKSIITNQKTNGFVSIWNLPTRTLTSAHVTKESLQSVAFHDDFGKIVTLGNESVVSYWSRSRAAREERAWMSAPSGFTISTNEANGLMAVGGSSDLVDVFAHVGNKAFSLSFR